MYVSLYLVRLGTSTVGLSKPSTFADVLTFAGTLLRETFIPGALGGPWRWTSSGVQALTSPPPALAWASWVLAVLVVLASLMSTWRAWRAWAILAGWLLAADIIPVLAGRSSLLPAVLLGLSARYVWDAVAILVLCLGLAFMPLADAPGPRRVPRRLSRPEFAASTTLIVAVIFGSLWSFYAYPADPAAAGARSYLATARIALADAPRGTVIVDDPVPSDVTGGPFLGPVSQASAVLSPLLTGRSGTRPQFVAQPDGTYNHLMEFDGFGRLVPSDILGVASEPIPGGSACWPTGAGVVVVPLTTLATHASTLRIGYLGFSPARISITFGSRTVMYDVQKGTNAVYLPVAGASADIVFIQQVSGHLPCVGDVQAGVLLPSEAGPAIPPLAATG